MVIGVPGSGKQEFIVRFIILAAKLKLKIGLYHVHNNTMDSLLARLISYQNEQNIDPKDHVKFVKIT